MFDFWVMVNDIQLQLDRNQVRLDTIRNKAACGETPTRHQISKLARIHKAMKQTASIRG